MRLISEVMTTLEILPGQNSYLFRDTELLNVANLPTSQMISQTTYRFLYFFECKRVAARTSFF